MPAQRAPLAAGPRPHQAAAEPCSAAAGVAAAAEHESIHADSSAGSAYFKIEAEGSAAGSVASGARDPHATPLVACPAQ